MLRKATERLHANGQTAMSSLGLGPVGWSWAAVCGRKWKGCWGKAREGDLGGDSGRICWDRCEGWRGESGGGVPGPDGVEVRRAEGMARLRGALLAPELNLEAAADGEAVEQRRAGGLEVDRRAVERALAQRLGAMLLR